MSDKTKVPASKDQLQPIFCDHVRMSVGPNGIIYFDFRTLVPDYSDFDKNPGTQLEIDFNEKATPPHTRIAMPMNAAIALRQVLLNSIQIGQPSETPAEPAEAKK